MGWGKAQPGSVVSLYWDSPNRAAVGDVIETATTGRRYEIVSTRLQERGKHIGRQHFKARVLAPDEEIDPDVEVWLIYWYRR